jgi:RNA polymerase sigma-70 factor (ECF subfamily)
MRRDVAPRASGAGMTDPTGWDLVAAAQAGDRDAFGELYAQYAGGVSRFVGNRLRDRGAVEDLTSETFVRALRRIDSVCDQGRDVGAWFTTIARNLVLDHVKSSRHRLETTTAEVADADTHQDSPEQAAITKETTAELHRHVARLPTAQQECIRRRFWEELSVAETAVAMDRGEGAVKALTHRAIVGLRASLTGRPAVVPVTRQRQTPDPLARAQQAVAEVAQHVADADPASIESDRAEQLARWHADDQTAARAADTGASASAAGGAA